MDVSKAFKSRSMRSMLGDHVLRNGLPRIAYNQTKKTGTNMLPGASSDSSRQQGKGVSMFSTMNKLVKRKLNLGARVLQVGGIERLFKQIFTVREEEQLLNAFQCSLSTTSGPIAGRIFISTDRIAFCSDRAIAKFASPTGDSLRFHYKVVIPLSKIKRTNKSENVKKPSQKYLQLVTNDDFDFWFMGFKNCRKTFKCIQQAISQIS